MKDQESKPESYELFKNGKLNCNWPRGYNLLLGSADNLKSNSQKYVFDIDVPLIPTER